MITCRLIYRSIVDHQHLKPSQIGVLANQAARNNRKLGLYGILIHSNGRFLQLIEGPSKFVNEVFCKIVKDPRHYQIELISFENIVKPEFADWTMKLLDIEEIDEGVKNFLLNKYPNDDGEFTFIDDQVLMTSFLMDIKQILCSTETA